MITSMLVFYIKGEEKLVTCHKANLSHQKIENKNKWSEKCRTNYKSHREAFVSWLILT